MIFKDKTIKKIAEMHAGERNGFVCVSVMGSPAEVIIMGDPSAMLYGISCAINRISEITEIPYKEIVEVLKKLKGKRPAKLIKEGEKIKPVQQQKAEDFIMEALEEYKEKYRDEMKSVLQKKNGEITKLWADIDGQNVMIAQMKNKIEEQKEAHAKEKKCLNKEIKRLEAEIKRMEKIIKRRDTDD